MNEQDYGIDEKSSVTGSVWDKDTEARLDRVLAEIIKRTSGTMEIACKFTSADSKEYILETLKSTRAYRLTGVIHGTH